MLSIGPVTSFGKSNKPFRPQENNPGTNEAPDRASMPKRVDLVYFDYKNNVLRLNSDIPGSFDAAHFAQVNKDGSGSSISAWGIGFRYPEGTFTELFEMGKRLCEIHNGKIPQEITNILHVSFKAIEENNKENAIPVNFSK